MKKTIIVIIMLILVCGIGYTQENVAKSDKYDEAKKMYLKIYNSSVSIFSTNDRGLGICSGTVLTNNENSVSVLTAKHCVGTYEEVYVENVLVKYTIVSTDDDIALLIMENKIPNKIPLTFAQNDAKLFSYIFHIGFPNFEEYSAYGKVWLKSLDHFYAKMTIISGCSGGGVFNINGDFVGIAWGSNGDRLAVMEPLSDVIRFLQTIYDF